jgi:hypothetical protein
MVRKELTKEMILKGQFVKYADCTRLIPEMDTVVCELIAEDGEFLETDAVFFFKGAKKDAPFTLTKAEIELLTESVQ